MRPVRLLCLALLSLCEMAPHAAAQTVAHLEGNFQGTLQAGEAQLHLVLHLNRQKDGLLHAFLDSLDQGVMAIEASSVSITGSVLKLEVTSVGAKYTGTFSADGHTIDGTWSQGSASLPLVFHREAPGAASRKPTDAVAPVEGLWQAAFVTHGLRLRFQLHIAHTSEGQLVAGLDSIDQGVTGLPATRVTQTGSAVHFEIPALGGEYNGTLNPARNLIVGSWSQTGADQTKLDFKRSDQPLELLRPQNPVKPYPYTEENVTFTNDGAKVTLAGTLTLPKGPGPFPATVLIAGSGPEDRDAQVANHRPFLVLADYLTRKGIAVLRYDKRGIGDSTGAADAATTVDLAADAQAALTYLRTRKEMDPARIGLIGHSEGAIIAPLIASTSKDVAWIVLLSAPATKGEDTMLNQSELIARAGGLTDEQIAASLEFDHAAYTLVRNEKDQTQLMEKIVAQVKATGFDSAIPPAALESQLRMLTSPWFKFFIDYDPSANLLKVKCPVLAIYGQKDLQVPPKVNMPIVQSAFLQSGNKDTDVRELPDLNHLLQHAYSGSPAEYPAIDETIAPQVLQIIADWILKHSSAPVAK